MKASDEGAAASRALEAAFHAHRHRLFSYLRRRVGRDEANDLLQEIFARAAKRGRFDDVECPAAYLRRIARNLLIDRARKHKLLPMAALPLDEERDAGVRPDQTWGIEADDVMTAWRRATDIMSPKTRTVFLMSRVEENSYREIADRLGLTTAGVEYHIGRALAICRRVIMSRR